MADTRTPSAILSAAADLIRDTAAAATPGPWETIGDTGGLWREATPERSLRTSPGYLGSMDAAENARWIALLSPDKAPLLETLLRLAAVEEEHPSPLEYGSATISSFMTVLRELARQIVEAHDVR